MNETPRAAGARCRRRIVFQGRVQGVGFRYTAASAARSCGVAGYVRNCADGTVELVAEAHVEAIERMLASLSGTFAGNIERQRVEEMTPQGAGALEGFEIRR